MLIAMSRAPVTPNRRLRQAPHGRRARWSHDNLKLSADHRHAWTNLGIVLAYQGRINDSLSAFERVSGKAAAHSNVGVILAQKGQSEDAAHHLRNAVALDPALRQPQAFLAQLGKADMDLIPADGETSP
jgi:Tfp pilus assembly protein PilF